MAKPKKTQLNGKDNTFNGTNGNDQVYGNGGDDILSGGKGNDKLFGGAGNDTLRGGSDDDVLNGGSGNDRLLGGAGDDILIANKGNDIVDGGAGDDIVKLKGNFADAVITEEGSYLVITIGEQVTKVKNVELFQFADGTKTLEEVKPTVVEPVNLTIGQDTIVGTAGDDVFNAAAVNPISGAAATTLQAFDNVDGGAGNDTLNIYTSDDAAGPFNATQQGTVTNIETINIYTDRTATFGGGTFDASKFVGSTAIWQIGGSTASTVTEVAATQTIGFKDVSGTFSVTAATAAAAANVALSNVAESSSIVVAGSTANAALNAVTISGTVADTDTSGTVDALSATVTVGKDQQALAVNSAVAIDLTVNSNGKDVTSVDASASTGAITYDADDAVASIKGGSAADTLTINTATTATIAASLDAGAGNDTITVDTGALGSVGTTTINAGAGDDSVNIDSRSTGKLTLNLGEGNDTFTVASGVQINGTDVIDGGAGTDTLQLNLVGAANIGAFSNFEVFDAKALSATLDVAILASKNTVTEIITTGAVTGGVLTNLGAGVGFRATGDMAGTGITLTQATAGALAITLDADEKTPANGTSDSYDMEVTATNATALTATFASDFADAPTTAIVNTATINLDGVASTLSVVSGGKNVSQNVFNYDDIATGAGGSVDALTTVTVSGAAALELNFVTSTKLASVDASALTGALTFDTADLKASTAGTFDGGKVTLGSGDDVINLVNGATVANIEKGSAEDLTVQSGFDVFDFGATAVAQAADVTLATGVTYSIKDGLLTFAGAGPTDLDAAFDAVDAALAATGGATVVFQYLSNSYIFVSDGTVGGTDTIVKLEGVNGLAGIDELGTTDTMYLL